MTWIGLVLIVAALAWFGIAQRSFVDAYLAWKGGPTRTERNRMFFYRWPDYWALQRKPPFGLRSMFQPLADPHVEHLRKRVLMACGIVLVSLVADLFSYGFHW